jgi:transcriptional regulator with XRE-family HTH domain
MTDKKSASNLKIWIKRNNLTIIEFAKMVGCHRNTINSIISGYGVEESISRIIYFLTQGEIEPLVKRKL